MKMRIILALFALLSPALLLAQGAIDGYMKNKGELDVALSFSHEGSDVYYAGPNEIDYDRTTQSIGAFAAYGIHKRINVIANLPFINGNLQDGSIYAKGLILNNNLFNAGNLSLIGAIGYSTPLSDYKTESGDAVGQQTTAILPRLVAQYNFKFGWFLNARYGYNLNEDPVPDTYVYSFKTGYASGKWYTDVWVEIQEADGGKDYRGVGELRPDSFRELGVEHTKIGGVVYYGFKPNKGVFLGWGAILDGRNTAKANRLSVGYVHKFNFSKNN